MSIWDSLVENLRSWPQLLSSHAPASEAERQAAVLMRHFKGGPKDMKLKPEHLAVGETFEDWLILGPCGELIDGTQSLILGVRSVRSNIEGVLKLPSPAAMARKPQSLVAFDQERELTRRLTHVNLVERLTDGRSHGWPYLITRRYEADLAKYVQKNGQLTRSQIWDIFTQIALGLEDLHSSHKHMHGDIKPHNVALNGLDENKPHARIIDLGLARAINAAYDRSLGFGSVAYTRPSVPRLNAPNLHDDTYCLVVMLLEQILGNEARKYIHDLFAAITSSQEDEELGQSLLNERLLRSVEDAEDIPDALRPLLLRALDVKQKDPVALAELIPLLKAAAFQAQREE